MNRPTTTLTTTDHAIPSSDGESSLFVRHYQRGNPRVHFLIVHGAMEHSGRHIDQVNFWLKSFPEVAVTVFDLLGHGKSGGARCYVGKFGHYVEDLKKVGEFVQSKITAHTKSFICAHSLGGLITLTRVLDSQYGWPFPIEGLIFSSPCIRPKMVLADTSEALLARMDVFAPKLHIPTIYRGADLTHDPARANDFDTDPLIPKFLTVRMARELISASSRLRGLSYYMRLPCLFLIAGTDKIVDAESTLLFAQGIDKRLCQIIQYPKSHHELWNETDRQEIFATMKTWVDKRLKERA